MGWRATVSPASQPRWSFQESSLLPAASLSLSPPQFQHRGQLPPARHRPERRARSREPRIPAPPPLCAQPQPEAAPRRLQGAARRVPASPPPTATASLSPPCSLPRSRISPPGTPDPAPGRGGAGRGGKSGSPEEAAVARGARSWNRLFCFLGPNPLPQPFSLAFFGTPEAMQAAFGLLKAFWSSYTPKL